MTGGFIKNAPTGSFIQPGTVSAPETVRPASAWVVHYDERDDWGRAPMLFASKSDALKYIQDDHSWWSHADHPFDAVMAALADSGEYTFSKEDEMDEDTSPYQIWLQEVAIAGNDEEISPDHAEVPVAPRAESPILVALDAPRNLPRTGARLVCRHLCRPGRT